ncbi:hypothetical protein F5141DRAFT_1061310 [Pisolithus sp. B1]|nr:hypothetical protein F5141DRAFT_1061310 [Pisolithus sp. B1]
MNHIAQIYLIISVDTGAQIVAFVTSSPSSFPPLDLFRITYQPRVTLLPKPFTTLVPVLIFIGRFLGNYFRILVNDRVEGFPFNVLRDPTYAGGRPHFATTALWYERPTGLLITLYVYIVYLITLRYKGPFTDMIYSSRLKAEEEDQHRIEEASISRFILLRVTRCNPSTRNLNESISVMRWFPRSFRLLVVVGTNAIGSDIRQLSQKSGYKPRKHKHQLLAAIVESGVWQK